MKNLHLVATPDAGMVQGVKVAAVRPGEVGSVQGQLSLHFLHINISFPCFSKVFRTDLVKLIGHRTANPAEQASSGQGGFFAKAHGSSCCCHHHSETKG